MSTMTSAWQTGTYDLLIYQDPEAEPGALMVVVFAAPTDIDDSVADDDAPILAHVDVPRAEYDDELAAFMMDMHSCGDRGLIRPEDVEAVYGTKLGLKVLLALFQAVENDVRGVDMDGHPFRPASLEPLLLRDRIQPMIMDMIRRISGS